MLIQEPLASRCSRIPEMRYMKRADGDIGIGGFWIGTVRILVAARHTGAGYSRLYS